MSTGTVPVSFHWLGIKSYNYAKVFSYSMKNVPRYPQLVTDGDAFTRSYLIFPLCRHHLSISTSKVNASTSTNVKTRDNAATIDNSGNTMIGMGEGFATGTGTGLVTGVDKAVPDTVPGVNRYGSYATDESTKNTPPPGFRGGANDPAYAKGSHCDWKLEHYVNDESNTQSGVVDSSHNTVGSSPHSKDAARHTATMADMIIGTIQEIEGKLMGKPGLYNQGVARKAGYPHDDSNISPSDHDKVGQSMTEGSTGNGPAPQHAYAGTEGSHRLDSDLPIAGQGLSTIA